MSLVDALVSDEDVGVMRAIDMSAFASRSSTPSIPPGFGLPHAHPEPIVREDPITKPVSRIAPTAPAFTPSRNPLIIPGVTAPFANVSLPPTPTRPSRPTSQAKQDVKTLASTSGLSKTIALQSSTIPPGVLQPEEFPALDSPKLKSFSTKTAASAKPPTPAAISKRQVPQIAAKAPEKRTPGVLSITTTVKPVKASSSSDTQSSSTVPTSSFPPLPQPTPSTSSSSVLNPLQRPSMITTKSTKSVSKTDTPTAGNTPSSATAPNPPVSRHPTVASTAKLERSGTPTSEIISDNASVTSASISRTNSPPPASKIGSAPVRMTTKSMQKKQRREAQREKEKFEIEAAAVIPKPEPEPEIGPIMGRKKKQKKEKAVNFSVSSVAGGSTPAASRPSSPGPMVDATIERTKAETAATDQENKNSEKELLNTASKQQDYKGKGKNKAQRPASPEQAPASLPAVENPHEAEVVEKPMPTPATVLQELLSYGVVADINNTFLKAPNTTSRHLDSPIDLQNSIPKLAITPEDRATLLSGKPVRKSFDGHHRIMLTPNGDCVRNLTLEEEERFLELQLSIAQEAGPTAFCSAKYNMGNGFNLIGGRAVPNGPPSFFPVLNTPATPIDPVAKIHRDEALNYINQYVLPSLSTNTQLEKALNANALEAEMLRSSDPSTWATWANDPASVSHGEKPDLSFGANLNGSLESMTAHFAIGRDIDRAQPLGGNVSMLSLSDAESALQIARKETEGLEKRLNALLKKNKRLLLGSGH
jgi:CCR4-NOT transcription complex subunit 4